MGSLCMVARMYQLPPSTASHAGSRAELAKRLAARSLLPLGPGIPIQRRPSKPQLIYIAAICSRQGLVPELGVITTMDGARLWLTANQDLACRNQ